MITYRQYRPAPQLAPWVECYWVYDCPAGYDRIESLIPGGRVELIFSFGNNFQWLISPENPIGHQWSGTRFMGQRDRVFGWHPSGPAHFLGIRFKPGGLAAFTPVPVSDLLNQLVPADCILGATIKEWEDRLHSEPLTGQRLSLLDELLLTLLQRNDAKPAFGPVLELIRRHPDETSIQTICDQTGMYYKKLERLFEASVGYRPKQYYRIVRFNKAIRRMNGEASLTAIGYDCGYYDQSHFIRDFRRFAGVAPRQFQPGDHTIAGLLIRHQPV